MLIIKDVDFTSDLFCCTSIIDNLIFFNYIYINTIKQLEIGWVFRILATIYLSDLWKLHKWIKKSEHLQQFSENRVSKKAAWRFSSLSSFFLLSFIFCSVFSKNRVPFKDFVILILNVDRRDKSYFVLMRRCKKNHQSTNLTVNHGLDVLHINYILAFLYN